jgi:hypothetical protein
MLSNIQMFFVYLSNMLASFFSLVPYKEENDKVLSDVVSI